MALDPVGLLYLAASIATLVAALLPRLLGRVPVSMPMVFVAAGMGAFALFPGLPDPDPIAHPELALHITEVCVIVSLMGAGLAINRRFAWRTWSTTWRLLGITCPSRSSLWPSSAGGASGWARPPPCCWPRRSHRPIRCWRARCRSASPSPRRAATTTRRASPSRPRRASTTASRSPSRTPR